MASADLSADRRHISEATSPPPLPLRDRATLWGGIVGVSIISWLYLIRMPMSAGALPAIVAGWLSVFPPRVVDLWLVFMMWAVMMVAMMLPSASPMIAMYARIARDRADASGYSAWFFAGAYLVVWTLFSIAATIGQWALQQFALLRGDLTAPPLIGAVILAVAGIFQLTPLKNACLSNCRSPLGFFMTEWRSGNGGAFRMGLKHGVLCVGCCWALMALLFVMGVMNLVWVAVLTAFVLIEKATPFGPMVARASGIAMIVAGVLLAWHR